MSVNPAPTAPRRPRAPSRTARGRLMFPKPKLPKWKPEEIRSRTGEALFALQSEAEILLEQILQDAHLAGRTEDGLIFMIELPCSQSTLLRLCEFGEARKDLDIEPDGDQHADVRPSFSEAGYCDVHEDSEDDDPREVDDPPEQDDHGGGNVEDEGEPEEEDCNRDSEDEPGFAVSFALTSLFPGAPRSRPEPEFSKGPIPEIIVDARGRGHLPDGTLVQWGRVPQRRDGQ